MTRTKENTSGNLRYFLWWLLPDSNWGHKALQASALPTELKSQPIFSINNVLLIQKIGAGKETLTPGLFLGKEAL